MKLFPSVLSLGFFYLKFLVGSRYHMYVVTMICFGCFPVFLLVDVSSWFFFDLFFGLFVYSFWLP